MKMPAFFRAKQSTPLVFSSGSGGRRRAGQDCARRETSRWHIRHRSERDDPRHDHCERQSTVERRCSRDNASTVTLNGVVQPTRTVQGPASTNKAGQLNDTVGLLAPARTAAQDKPLIQLLNTQAVTVTNKNTITFTVPGGSKYSATATRTLTNVGLNGKINSNYTLTTSQPVVSAVP
jgi:hypothetical protein